MNDWAAWRSSLAEAVVRGAALLDTWSRGRPAGPRPSTARQGRAQRRGPGRTAKRLRHEVKYAPPLAARLIPIKGNSATHCGTKHDRRRCQRCSSCGRSTSMLPACRRCWAGMGGGCAGFRSFGTYSAQLPVDARSEPDTTGQTKDRPLTMFLLVRGRFGWCGGSRIRTLEGISRRIYRPLPLAARATRLEARHTGRQELYVYAS